MVLSLSSLVHHFSFVTRSCPCVRFGVFHFNQHTPVETHGTVQCGFQTIGVNLAAPSSAASTALTSIRRHTRSTDRIIFIAVVFWTLVSTMPLLFAVAARHIGSLLLHETCLMHTILVLLERHGSTLAMRQHCQCNLDCFWAVALT